LTGPWWTTNPQREQLSLFGEILDWMLAPLLLLWPMSVALTWLVAQSIANRPYDRELGRTGRARRAGQVANLSGPSDPAASPVRDGPRGGRGC
jgi:two-component system sensor histidine kinase TctE